jgi:hypothetical protein
MDRSKIIIYSFLHALGIMAYAVVVLYVMDRIESAAYSFTTQTFSALPFLLLIILSAGVVGSLIFVRPLHLYLSSFKKEGIYFLIWTLGFLLLITVLVIAWMFGSNPYGSIAG